MWSASTGSPNGPPIIAGGLVWALNWHSGFLYGMSPSSGHVTVVRSTGDLEHFATPGVGDERLLVPTKDGIVAFGTTG